jgi:hypothetical protein
MCPSSHDRAGKPLARILVGMTATVCVAVVGTRAEAELIAGMLRSHGVPAVVSTDDAGGVEVALQAQGVRVLVPARDAAGARRLLDEPAPKARPLNRFQRWLVRRLGGDPG